MVFRWPAFEDERLEFITWIVQNPQALAKIMAKGAPSKVAAINQALIAAARIA